MNIPRDIEHVKNPASMVTLTFDKSFEEISQEIARQALESLRETYEYQQKP